LDFGGGVTLSLSPSEPSLSLDSLRFLGAAAVVDPLSLTAFGLAAGFLGSTAFLGAEALALAAGYDENQK